ncbi:MAG TPA: hypothetical protein VMG41_01930 [Gemmatimonadales bacterium]|nr:hypothetical protein [Gemmatimonadales bacterium]
MKLLVEKARERTRIFAGTERGASSADRLQLDGRHVAYLLNTCFWASMRPEGGRPARGEFTIVDRTVPGGLRFTEPVIVSQESVVHLSPGLGSGLAAVDLSAEDMPQIWGVLEAAPPWQPVIHVIGPAHLAVSLDREVLGVIRGGEIQLVKSGPYSLANLVAPIIDRTDAAPSPDRLARVEQLFRILASVERNGQGGTVLVAPTGQNGWAEALRFRYTMDERSTGFARGRLGDLDDPAGEDGESAGRASSATRPSRPRSLLVDLSQRLLAQIAQLAAIDGAVVLGDDLSLVGFGASVTLPAEDFTLSHADAVSGLLGHGRPITSLPWSDEGGAGRFVRRYPDCLGFQVSRDGAICLFAWGGPDRRLVALTGVQDLLTEY